jgi:hypothetical protein
MGSMLKVGDKEGDDAGNSRDKNARHFDHTPLLCMGFLQVVNPVAVFSHHGNKIRPHFPNVLLYGFQVFKDWIAHLVSFSTIVPQWILIIQRRLLL